MGSPVPAVWDQRHSAAHQGEGSHADAGGGREEEESQHLRVRRQTSLSLSLPISRPPPPPFSLLSFIIIHISFLFSLLAALTLLPPPPPPFPFCSSFALTSSLSGVRESAINRAQGLRQSKILASEAVQIEQVNKAKGKNCAAFCLSPTTKLASGTAWEWD